MRPGRIFGAVLAGLALALVGIFAVLARDNYELKLVVPSAAQVVVGAEARIDGAQVGSVSALAERDGKAIVTVKITDTRYVPLHEGTTSRIEWQSVLGERVVTIKPGPAGNAALPSGAMYEAESSQVEADQVLAALDEPTRERLNSLIAGARVTTQGHEQNIAASLRAAGPSVEALGEILAAVGRDGPAIREVVTEMHQMASGLAERQDRLSGTVRNLTQFTRTVGDKNDQLARGLAELPSTLDAARTTLDKVPAVTDATVPLLDDLRPAAARLPAVADNLDPVMRDLRPTLRNLRPTLEAAEDLLGNTPGLFDTAHQTLPALAHAIEQFGPPAEFLRPYTPEVVSFVNLFGGSFSAYDAQGHGWSVSAVPGAGSVGELPGQVPLAAVESRPAPGTSVGQPWTDAHGGEIR